MSADEPNGGVNGRGASRREANERGTNGRRTDASGSGTPGGPGEPSDPSSPGDSLLELDGVHAAYGGSQVLRGVTMAVDRGEVASLIGRNGVGKTTTLRSIVGVLVPHAGTVTFDGKDLTELPDHARIKRGVGYVPEDRQVFPELTVAENLKMGSVGTDGGTFTVEEVYELFPRLDERRSNAGSQLSGGEQQMLAIARALLSRTELLLLDEPTEGLAPQIVADVLEIIADVRERGLTVLLVEQNVRAAMEVADRHYVLDGGEIVFEGTGDELDAAEDVKNQHLGVGVGSERDV